MKKIFKKFFLMILVSLMAISSTNGIVKAQVMDSHDNSAERKVNINQDWKFKLTTSDAYAINYDDSSWKDVSLPHDFSISQNFTTSGEAESGFLPGGTGWYRKKLVLDATNQNKAIVLNFDGVYENAYVYVNGKNVGENHYGYTSFAFDISDELICDGVTENVIAVKAVNNIPSSRWYSGSGIYRDVELIISDKIHIDYQGTYVTTPQIASGKGVVNNEISVVNDSGQNTTVEIKDTVYNSSDEVVSTSVEQEIDLTSGENKKVTLVSNVSNPLLWDVDNPNLYYVRTEVIKDGIVLDTYDTTFGFRYFSFNDNTGFYLNGKAVKLNGVCLHHDQGALGSAAYDDAMYRQLTIMKDMGVNAIRTSHNPADEHFIDMCNQLGLLVIEEAFDGWELPKNGNSNDFSQYFNSKLNSTNLLGSQSNMTWAEFAIKSMIKRDRNDPSIILWSIGNEVQEGTSTNSNFAAIASKLIGYVKEVDLTRPSTIGSNRRDNSGTYGNLHSAVKNAGGIVGFNYASASELSSMHNSYGAIIASETSSAVNSRGIYMSQSDAGNADGKYHLTSYDTSKVGWGKTAHDSIWDTLTLDYVAGEFVWTGFDYLGEPTPWNGTDSGSKTGKGAIPNSSYFGMVDTAGFEKDTYYLYRSQWNQKDTTLHLVTAWDKDNMMTTNKNTPVVIYSNAPIIELYRDGKLIGTATRNVATTKAGHKYYTYTVKSNDSSICSAIAGSNSTSLYATFNVSYVDGTISAKALDQNRNEIGNVHGTTSISTPGNPTQLKVTQDKMVINADGTSLAYLEVDVLDANGNLDTTATNNIQFSLTGQGEIVGVDNGDQATLNKYQQSSVLKSSSLANIQAYAGKALVVVKSTTQAGNFSVNVTSNGLTGKTVFVETKKVLDDKPVYSYLTDYTVKIGNMPAFDSVITKIIGDQRIPGIAQWQTDDLNEKINQAGHYEINGIAIFEDGTSKQISVKLHVIDNIIAMQNISTATIVGNIPELPTMVKGILKNGVISETSEFNVTWDKMTASQFNNVGDIVTVSGIATIMEGENLPVTATIRVAEVVNTESINVASSASSLTQNIAPNMQSDNLESIRNGITKPGDNTNERWTNWNNRTTSNTAILTFKWDTAQILDRVQLYYYFDNCAALPKDVKFEYSLNGTDFIPIEVTAKLEESYSLGAQYFYTFAKPINPIALRIILTQQNGTTGSNCVGLTEVEIMTFKGSFEYEKESNLDSILVDGTEIENYDENTYSYNVKGQNITATTTYNVAYTILPEYEGVVRILTLSEDGQNSKLYEITLDQTPVCEHKHTTLKNYQEATCTDEGYSGDLYCEDCQTVVASGKSIAPLGHLYDNGIVTKEPTETEEGIKTYTCQRCSHVKLELIPKLTVNKSIPIAKISAEIDGTSKIKLIGQYHDFENIDKYYQVVEHGLVYYSASKLGTRALNINTPGRTKVTFSSYKNDGSFSYSFTPAYSSTSYVVRSYLAYKDSTGRTLYVYSTPLSVSYDKLK